MPADAFEVQEAEAEGVQIRWLTSLKEIAGPRLTVEVMELGTDGRPRPTGEFETLPVDTLVLALGQQTESAFLGKIPGVELEADGTVRVGPDMMTGCPGIFAGGDMAPGERTVTAAVGHGKRAAQGIDAWLRSQDFAAPVASPLVTFDMLHLPIYSDAERREQAQRPPAERTDSFAEVLAGLREPEARYEAKRCFSCGNCFYCDQCYAACPEQAIEKLGPGLGYRYLYDRCTGCAICYETCPCHAIEMIPEPVEG
jgi:NADPH-dependent glutamate synthase beta subunit-like oxidoreductase